MHRLWIQSGKLKINRDEILKALTINDDNDRTGNNYAVSLC